MVKEAVDGRRSDLPMSRKGKVSGKWRNGTCGGSAVAIHLVPISSPSSLSPLDSFLLDAPWPAAPLPALLRRG